MAGYVKAISAAPVIRLNTSVAEFVGVSTLSLGLTSFLLARTLRMVPGSVDYAKPWDHQRYIQMALHGLSARPDAPFAWRVAIPFLAGALPFGLEFNFLLLTFLSLVLTGITLYFLVRRFGFSRVLSLTGLLMFFSLGWAAKFLLQDFWLVDAASFFAMSLVAWMIVAKRDWGFALALALGVIVKESVLFVAPLYYSVNAARLFDGRTAARLLILALPATLGLALLHVLVPAGGEPYSYTALLRSIGMYRLEAIGSVQLLKEYSVNPFGLAVFFLPFLGLPGNRSLWFRLAPFILLIYSQLLFAINTERLIVAGFPAFILLSLTTLRMWSSRFRIDERFWLIPVAVLYLMLLRKPEQVSLPLETQAVILAACGFAIGLVVLLKGAFSLRRAET